MKTRPLHCRTLPRWLGPAVLALGALLPVLAWARAGGGEGYSGGGGGGGFDGGDGGGGEIVLLRLLIWLIFRYPAVGVPVAIVAAGLFFYGGKSGRSAYVSRTIRTGFARQATGAYRRAEEALRTRDPGFSADALAARGAKAFLAVQKAWHDGNLSAVRHLLSDGVYERFTLLRTMQEGALTVNRMEQVSVRAARPVGIASDRFFDTVHIAMEAQAADWMERTDTGALVQGAKDVQPFTEIWSFLRRPGAATLAQPGLLEGHCPNCGTPLQLADAITCPSCGALVNSGEYDWVLAEITQVNQWVSRPPETIPGLEDLAARDPGFHPQHVEDRVSVMFWRRVAAEFFADARYLEGLATEEFFAREKARVRPGADGLHQFYAHPAVAAVEIRAVELAGPDEVMDRIHANVLWSGYAQAAFIPGYVAPDSRRAIPYTHDFILGRHKAALSSQKNSLSSEHCPGCGAPRREDSRTRCAYCGVVQNDGSADWVLMDVQPFVPYRESHLSVPQAEPEAEDPLAGFSPPQMERLLLGAAALMLADGVVDPRERRGLDEMARRKRIAPERVEALLQHVQTTGAAPEPTYAAPAQSYAFLSAMVRMCLMDGSVCSAERQLLRALAAKSGYSEADIDHLIARARGELYKAAKKVLGKAA